MIAFSVLAAVAIAVLLPVAVNAGLIPEWFALFLQKNAIWIGLGTLLVAIGGAVAARKRR
jgi:hypothetical protein